ncbi:MAG: ATP-grasp domain-containing protein [Candidatus Omnitrophica bacterium]|nr:ATP-grasp domain-containing protein [Candidatus Omnitrophota bacterium]MDD5429506.1 ATP-grasp domain-containing protein [Candidatus Omnitrophota bacterium]
MRIGLTYNLKEEALTGVSADNEAGEEFDNIATIEGLCEVIVSLGHEPVKLGFGLGILEKISREKIDFVFNIAEGQGSRNRESHVPSILEMAGIPYSGSDALTLGLALDKIVAKKIIRAAGVPTPAYRQVSGPSEVYLSDKGLKYPLITKPSWEGSSKGIYNSSKAYTKKELDSSLSLLFSKYPGQPILVEEYIEGREVTLGIIGNNPASVLGIMEITNRSSKEKDFFYSLQVKRRWKELVNYTVNPDIPGNLLEEIKYYSLRAFKEFGCRDLARVDFKISRENKPYLLEINPLPGLSCEYSDLVILARQCGWKYEGLISEIINQAFCRYGLKNSGIKFNPVLHGKV